MTTNVASTRQEKNTTRRLDYMADCTNGHSFTMVPDKLMAAYLSGEMPEPKFKLICLMIHHAKSFQIWRSTLERTVSNNSLKKYLPQIIEEGYVEVESIPTGRGGAVKNVYHVRSLEHWAVYRDCASPNPPPVKGATVKGATVKGSPVEDITKPTSNKTNENKTNENNSGQPPADTTIKPTKRNIIGYLKDHYTYLSKESAELFLNELLSIQGNHFIVLKALTDKIGNKVFDNLNNDHRAIIKAYLRESA